MELLLGGFAHETNTFADDRTTRADFRAHREYVGEEIPTEMADTNSPEGGVVSATRDHDATLRYAVAASATPGGVVTDETYAHYRDRIVDAATPALDGVCLCLHGAMVTESDPDAEGSLVAAVREAVGPDVPIAVTLDLHGNLSDAFLDTADVVVAYETYPHTDMADTGRGALDLLVRTAAGEIDPVIAVERPPVLPMGPTQNTREGPMSEVMAAARRAESRSGVCKVNVLPGFHHADVPAMGFSIPVVADGDAALAREVSRELAREVWDRREAFVADYPDAATAVERAVDRTATREGPRGLYRPAAAGPVVLADLGDNPGGGGAADGTVLLRELLAREVDDAGVALIRDPAVVERAAAAGVGSRVRVPLGGKTDDRHGDPVPVVGYVKAITDGRFRNTGPMGTGSVARLGRTVHLRCVADAGDDPTGVVDGPRDVADDVGDPGAGTESGDETRNDTEPSDEPTDTDERTDERGVGTTGAASAGVSVIVTEKRLQPLDAEIWRHVGVQPERLDVLVVKSTNHFRADYEPLASEVIPVDTPGVVAVDPRRFDYERITRPKRPLDEMADDAYPDWV